MKSFRQYVSHQPVEAKIREVAEVMAAMDVEPWRFFLDWHRGDERMESAILQKMNEQAVLTEDFKSWLGGMAQKVGDKLNPAGAARPDASAAQAVEGLIK